MVYLVGAVSISLVEEGVREVADLGSNARDDDCPLFRSILSNLTTPDVDAYLGFSAHCTFLSDRFPRIPGELELCLALTNEKTR